ncbi:MAG: DegT/DnrJ/EryC1/StrS family aminotransferase [Acidimicrobiales bacterium]
MDRIPIYRPLIGEEEVEAAASALRHGWLGMGSCVEEFELAVQKTVDADSRRALAVSTGYAALHLGLLLAGVGPGDEVIVPSFTHLADLQAILAVGAEPVLCDIVDATLCIDVERAAELVGPRTRAVIPIDYGCHLYDHEALDTLARAHGLRVVHDAAHSFGAADGKAMVGSFSDICMFSFDPVKAISCIDGGVVLVRTDEELARGREMRVLGSTLPVEVTYQNARLWNYDATAPGFRYHLSNVHAAIGLAQLDKLDWIRSSRQAACELYSARLGHLDGVSVPVADVSQLNPFLFYLRVGGGLRDAFRDHMATLGVDTGIHWTPAHTMTLFKPCRQGSLAVTDRVAAEVVSLPLHSGMQEAVVDRVCDVAESFFS